MSADESLLALDVGSVRIGVARANVIARIAEPLTTLANDEGIEQALNRLIDAERARTIVVGLPQNQHGEDTEQTRFVRDFAKRIQGFASVEIVFQDEADSSNKAEKILQGRGKPYGKGDIDAEAATLILQDFIEEQLI